MLKLRTINYQETGWTREIIGNEDWKMYFSNGGQYWIIQNTKTNSFLNHTFWTLEELMKGLEKQIGIHNYNWIKAVQLLKRFDIFDNKETELLDKVFGKNKWNDFTNKEIEKL